MLLVVIIFYDIVTYFYDKIKYLYVKFIFLLKFYLFLPFLPENTIANNEQMFDFYLFIW